MKVSMLRRQNRSDFMQENSNTLKFSSVKNWRTLKLQKTGDHQILFDFSKISKIYCENIILLATEKPSVYQTLVYKWNKSFSVARALSDYPRIILVG